MALTQIELGMLKDGILTADTAGRLKMADGFVNDAKISGVAASKVSGQLADANMAPGSILQIITSQYNTPLTVGSTSFVDMGVSAAITPISTASRILILFEGQLATGSTGTVLVNLLRGATTLAQPSSGGSPSSFNIYANSSNFSWPTNFIWIDSPNASTSTTYKLQWRLDFAGTGYLGRHVTNTEYNTPYSLTLMEIAG